MKFTELPLSQEVLAGIEKAGFVETTEVQANVLPVSLTGKDVMVQSKTGSGKTAIYLLTAFEKYLKSDGKSCALIVAPTRELALQIESDANLLSSYIKGYRVGCFYGGVGYNAQKQDLNLGVSLYVGTPGRLLDFAKNGQIDFRLFDTVILDEADRMFDMGFLPDIQAMFARMRNIKERQTMLFSATLSTNVRNLAWQYMNEPKEIEVHPEEITVKLITQELFHVTKTEKFGLLLQLLKKINPASCLIFTNTKDKAVEVSKRLNLNGYKSAYLMGDMAQKDRIKTLDNMKEGKIHFLIATDVAARGIQIDDLELVVNYDIPEDFEAYVHRIGRTARAGKSGKAITLACETYIYGLEAIEEYIGMKIPVLWADECDLPVVEDLSAGYKPEHKGSKAKGKSGSTRTSSTKNSQDRRKSAPRSKKEDFKEEKLDKSKTDFDKLSSLSLEERMAYYKKTYSSGSNKDTAKKPSSNTQAKRPNTGAPKKATYNKPKASESVKAPMPKLSSVPTNNTSTKVKKTNFLAKIISIFKK